MSKTTDELLAVLDMPEDEQKAWINEYCGKEKIDNTTLIPHPELGCEDYEIEISLADLAFRLRDEICKDSLGCDNYSKALHIVYRSFCKSQIGTIRQNMVPYELWLESFITAIERIIAALIAKEKDVH